MLLDLKTKEISAIEITLGGSPVPPPVSSPVPAPVTPPTFEDILINCGGDGYTDTLGKVWQADNWFVGGNVFSNTANNIIDTADDTVRIIRLRDLLLLSILYLILKAVLSRTLFLALPY